MIGKESQGIKKAGEGLKGQKGTRRITRGQYKNSLITSFSTFSPHNQSKYRGNKLTRTWDSTCLRHRTISSLGVIPSTLYNTLTSYPSTCLLSVVRIALTVLQRREFLKIRKPWAPCKPTRMELQAQTHPAQTYPPRTQPVRTQQ
jgi:hypothetical protein